jgi:hypothetical protein
MLADLVFEAKIRAPGTVRLYGHWDPRFCGVRLFNSKGRKTGHAVGDPRHFFLAIA